MKIPEANQWSLAKGFIPQMISGGWEKDEEEEEEDEEEEEEEEDDGK